MAESWLTFENGKWHPAQDSAWPYTSFADLRGYWSNLVDYARVLLCVAAAVTLAGNFPLATAALILGSTLLDWVDGPVARAHNQCTIFGSGVDWLADILAQVITLVWLGRLAPAWIPLLFCATAIEITNCIFDFGTTATGRYPVLDRRGGFGVILDWSMPGGSYSAFGTALWLFYPLFLLAWCLDLSWPVRALWLGHALRGTEAALALPAVLYVWCELAYTVFILERWREAPREAPPVSFDDCPAGVKCLGVLAPAERDLVERAWRESIEAVPAEWSASLDRKAVFWVNLWQRSGNVEKVPIACIEELNRWAGQMAARHYGADVELDGYGLIANPAGSAVQDWHVDYTPDYSTIFIPLTELAPENAMQYAVLPRVLPPAAYRSALSNLDAVDLRLLVQAGEWVSVRQLLAKPFSVILMDFGTIHRAVANTGNYDRVLFWVSVKRRGALLPPEPLFQAIPDDGEQERAR
jgi:phosphatidylglycerophosphate synthase